MKRGTASRVFIGGNKVTDDFGGLLLLSQVILGKKSGMFTDHTGLYITDNVMLGKGIARVITAVVHGTSPLSLPDAIADSLSYVKAFGGTEQRNLPDNYIERQFIYMMDGSYLLPNITPEADWHIEMDFQTTTLPSASVYFLGGRTETFGGLFFVKTSAGVFMVDAFGNTSNDRYTSSVSVQNNTHYKFTFNNKVAKLESGGTTLFTNTFTTENANGAALCINGLNNNGTLTASGVGIYLYSFKVWNAQGELVMDLVPAVQKGTVPVVGFYDAATGGFRTPTAGTFAAGGEAVPTPDTPMDIVSNNGVLKARHASGLPLGYTQLEYLTSGTDGQYIDTGILFDPTKNFRVVGSVINPDTLRKVILGNYYSPQAETYYSIELYSDGKFRNYMSAGGGRAFNIYSPTAVPADTIAYFDTSYNALAHQTTTTLRYGTTEQTYSGATPETTTVAVRSLKLFNDKRLSSYNNPVSIGAVQIYIDGVLEHNYVPVKRNSDNVLGMYDLVSGQFFTNQGTGTFTAGTAVSDPVEVYTTGPVETIAIKDDQDATVSTAVAEMLLNVGDYQDQQEIIDGTVTRNVGVKVLDGTEDWVLVGSGAGTRCHITEDIGLPNTEDLTSPMMCSHYQFGGYISGGSSTTQGTFNAFSRREPGNEAYYLRFSVVDMGISSASDFKNWLAQQYAAGTPVIVLYPLAEPTTESVTGQPMQTAAGDNTAEITQASMDGLELEAKYQKREQ